MKALNIIRDWALILAIVAGVAGYLIYAHLPFLDCTHRFANSAVAFLQPALIFCMLFLTFCKISPKQLRICRWHIWLLLIQGGIFTAIGLLLIWMPHSGLRIVLEGLMLCIICPTATASPVVTRKLGGEIAHITTYIILINFLAALLIPVLLPYVHPQPDLSTFSASMMILSKVFPLLLMPLLLAWLVRILAPRALEYLTKWQDAPFYLWIVALALAIAVTTRSIVHSNADFTTEAFLVVASLVSCIFQFWAGKRIGARYHDKIAAGQACGQKNTALAIWLGYTFFTPITSLAGGFYSIWHNVINSYQLYKHRKNENIHQ